MSVKHELTHFDDAGNARMVNVGHKGESERVAVAEGCITMTSVAYDMVKAGTMKKGDVLGVARIAGIMAAKKVDVLIPLCHPLAITRADISFTLDDDAKAVRVEATVGIIGRTGVEMEALTAVSVAALTIYDMCKAVDKGMEISDIRLVKKSGGKSGDYSRQGR
ncbi:MAG: cyclic pyranopterin monophosphate synthase MoaC [Candidatus Electrothrix sp. ATG2]|nr:cyclic pyranopterin monophosphate synthase MoaC [Candidatus Electrothrix sp. ATG2]